MCIDEKEAGRLIEKVDALEEKAEKAEKVFYNNGLIEKVARIEESIEYIYQNSRLNTEMNNKILERLETINLSVMEHHKDQALHSFKGLLFRRDVLAWFVVVMLVIHSLIPKEFDVWELLKHILGL